MGVTEELANFTAKTTFNDLPKEAVEHVKVCIFDWLGVALAGSLEPASKIIVRIIGEMAGREEATVIGTRLRSPCAEAALANGVTGHTVELDDIHEEAIIHPAATVVPAALAVAERDDLRGRDLITAVALGYEVGIRIGRAMNPSHYRFWHPTGTCGTFGAAAAAGKLLGLDEGGVAHAFGIAGTGAAGLIEVFGTMSKPLNAGRAAMGGVMAALLAQEGFTSSTRILEAEGGYLRAAAAEFDVGKVTEKLGEEFELMNNIFKRHASCGHTHGAIDAVLEIVERYGVRWDDVDEIVVGTYPIAANTVGGNYEPETPAEAKFSLPYCVATALIHGKVGLEEFSDERLADPRMRGLAKRVHVLVDPDYADARLGPAEVKIRTGGGEEYRRRVDIPKGYPENPLTGSELEAKFRALSSLALSEERVAEVLRTVNALENVDRIRDLCALLGR